MDVGVGAADEDDIFDVCGMLARAYLLKTATKKLPGYGWSRAKVAVVPRRAVAFEALVGDGTWTARVRAGGA